MSTKKKKAAEEKIDGLSPKDIAKLRAAIRQVWHWSYPKRLVVQRCTDAEGYPICEACKKRCPKIFVDHIEAVGDLDAGFFTRLFCPSSGLQGLCKKCHDAKTKAERREKNQEKELIK